MRQVQTSPISAANLNQIAQLRDSAWLNTMKASNASTEGRKLPPNSSRRNEFFNTVHAHVHAAEASDTRADRMSVGISNMTIPQSVEYQKPGMN